MEQAKFGFTTRSLVEKKTWQYGKAKDEKREFFLGKLDFRIPEIMYDEAKYNRSWSSSASSQVVIWYHICRILKECKSWQTMYPFHGTSKFLIPYYSLIEFYMYCSLDNKVNKFYVTLFIIGQVKMMHSDEWNLLPTWLLDVIVNVEPL